MKWFNKFKRKKLEEGGVVNNPCIPLITNSQFNSIDEDDMKIEKMMDDILRESRWRMEIETLRSRLEAMEMYSSRLCSDYNNLKEENERLKKKWEEETE